MRVITGIARGTRLRTLDGIDVRPTSEKVKEAVFSAIQFEIEQARVLDLFAGSGQLGIEALSRGAKYTVFIDNSPNSIAVIKENIKACKLDGQAKVNNIDYNAFLNTTDEVFDIAFVDPPYESPAIFRALDKLSARMSDSGIVVCEHKRGLRMPEETGRLKLYRQYDYSKTQVSIYKIEELSE